MKIAAVKGDSQHKAVVVFLNESVFWTRAVQLIEFDSHAHLVSKAGSVISG